MLQQSNQFTAFTLFIDLRSEKEIPLCGIATTASVFIHYSAFNFLAVLCVALDICLCGHCIWKREMSHLFFFFHKNLLKKIKRVLTYSSVPLEYDCLFNLSLERDSEERKNMIDCFQNWANKQIVIYCFPIFWFDFKVTGREIDLLANLFLKMKIQTNFS